jgi:TetR/AcrR family transcriptional repressor of nem operon
MSIGRPLQFDPEKVLALAMETFWTKGFEKTSLQDLLDATGLSKSSLYNAFGDKDELFQKCLRRYGNLMTSDLLKQFNSSESAVQFIEGTLLFAAGEAKRTGKPRGCMVMNTAAEFAQENKDVAIIVSESIGGFKAVFLKALEKAVEQGGVSARSDLKQLATFLVSSMAGIRSMVKGGVSDQEARSIVKIVMQQVH